MMEASTPGGASLKPSRLQSPTARKYWNNAKDKSVLLRRAADESRGEIEGLEDNVSTLQDAIMGHANALTLYKQQLRGKEDEVRALQQENNLLRSDIDHLTSKSASTDDIVRAAEDARRRALTQNAELEEQLRQKDSHLKDATMRLESLHQELSTARQKLCIGETELADLRRRLITSDANYDAAHTKAETTTRQLDQLQIEFNDLSHQHGLLDRRSSEDHHQRLELETLLERANRSSEELNDKLARSEGIIADLRREVQDMAHLKIQLSESQRQAADALEAKSGTVVELLKSEEALALALASSNSVEQMRNELTITLSKYESLHTRCSTAETTATTLEVELSTAKETIRQLEVSLTDTERVATTQADQNIDLRRSNAQLEELETVRKEDGVELQAIRQELIERRAECEELASGVQRMHTKVELERSRRQELEILLSSQPVRQLEDAMETQAANAQLGQVVALLDSIWSQLSPLAC